MGEKYEGSGEYSGEHEVGIEQVTALVQTIERPPLSAVRSEFAADRLPTGELRPDWLVCGPTNIALTRLLQSRLQLPLLHRPADPVGPFLSLHLSIYAPDYSSDTQYVSDHVYTKFDPGTGEAVYYIDPIAGLLWEGRTGLSDAIAIEPHWRTGIESVLAERHYLLPWSAAADLWPHVPLFNPPSPTGATFEMWESVLHDDRALSPGFAINGIALGSWAEKTVRVIRRLEADLPGG